MIVEGMEFLRHMLGVASHKPKRDWCYRNYFNSSDGGDDVKVLEWLESNRLVIRGRPNYWHATPEGCRAIGLNQKQIEKACPTHSAGI